MSTFFPYMFDFGSLVVSTVALSNSVNRLLVGLLIKN